MNDGEGAANTALFDKRRVMTDLEAEDERTMTKAMKENKERETMKIAVERAKIYMHKYKDKQTWREQSDKEMKERAKEYISNSKGLSAIEREIYLNALEQVIRIIPKEPPKDLSDDVLRKVKRKWKTIFKRLEAFDDKE